MWISDECLRSSQLFLLFLCPYVSFKRSWKEWRSGSFMIFLRSLFPCPMIASPILSHVHYLRFSVHFVFSALARFLCLIPSSTELSVYNPSHHITSQQKFCVVPPLQLVLVPLGTDGPQYISYNCLNTPAHVVEFFRYQNFLSFSSFGRAIPPYHKTFLQHLVQWQLSC